MSVLRHRPAVFKEETVEAIEINIESRDVFGSSANKKLRKSGKVPGVVYSQGQAAIGVLVDALHLQNTLKGVSLTHLFKMVSADKSINGKTVLIKDLQIDPVKQKVVHFDMYEIHKGQKVTVVVPVVLSGEPAAVKSREGSLSQSLFEVKVECQPTAIPESIILNVADMQLGTSLFVKDLQIPEGVKVKESEELNVATLSAAAEEEKAAVAAPAETAEAAPAAAAAAATAATPEKAKK